MQPPSQIRRLLVHFSHFFTGSFVSILFGLVTFPLLTRVLTQEQYGVLALINATAALIVAVAKAGLSDSIIRFYAEHASSRESLKSFTSTVLTRSAVVSAICMVLYLAAIPLFGPALGIKPEFVPAFLVMGIYLLMRPLDIVGLNYLRALGRTVFYNVIALGTRITSVALSIGLLLLFSKNLTAFVVGPAFSETAAVVILMWWLLSTHEYSPKAVSAQLSWRLIAFGAPLLVAELGYLLLLSADRYLIAGFRGQAELSVYAVGYNLPTYINDLVMFSVSYAIVPIYTELYTKQGLAPTRAFLDKALKYYLIAVIPMCFGYAAVAEDAIVLLASDKYRAAARFSPLILIALVVYGTNTIIQAGLYIQKRTRQISGGMIMAVAINIGCNLFLIPRFGLLGAAIATIIACSCSVIAVGFLSFRYIPVAVPVRSIAFYLATSALMYLALIQVHTDYAWLTLTIKLVLGGIYVPTVVLLRETEVRDELKRLRQKVLSSH